MFHMQLLLLPKGRDTHFVPQQNNKDKQLCTRSRPGKKTGFPCCKVTLLRAAPPWCTKITIRSRKFARFFSERKVNGRAEMSPRWQLGAKRLLLHFKPSLLSANVSCRAVTQIQKSNAYVCVCVAPTHQKLLLVLPFISQHHTTADFVLWVPADLSAWTSANDILTVPLLNARTHTHTTNLVTHFTHFNLETLWCLFDPGCVTRLLCWNKGRFQAEALNVLQPTTILRHAIYRKLYWYKCFLLILIKKLNEHVSQKEADYSVSYASDWRNNLHTRLHRHVSGYK